MHLLDTDILTYLHAGNPGVIERLQNTDDPEIGTTIITKIEVLRGRRKLTRIGRADLLIASIALAIQAVLVTRNLRHFKQIPDLIVVNWMD